MKIRTSILLSSLVFALFISPYCLAEVSKSRQKELERIILYDCTFCHGFDLEGDKGPPLLPYTLKQWPNEYLINVIRRGRPGTKMPSWSKKLTHEEILWIIKWLKTGKHLENRWYK